MDVDSIPLGADFASHLGEKVQQSDIVLALIGPNWADAVDPDTGEKRLHNPDDFVRIELRSALEQGRHLVPVFLDGATMPDERDLPDDLKPLARKQGEFIDLRTFDADVQRLTKRLNISATEAVTPEAPFGVISAAVDQLKQIPGIGLYGLGIATVTVLIGIWYLTRPPDDTAPSQLTASENSALQVLKKADDTIIRTAADAKAAAQAGKPVSERVFRDCVTCPLMVAIPAGQFQMGSDLSTDSYADEDETPRKEITFKNAFAIALFETTFDEWELCADALGCPTKINDFGWGRGKRPAINISWEDAGSYTSWLSSKTGKNYRLPSSAEWEYVARAGSTSPFAWPSGQSHSFANHGAAECCAGIVSGDDKWLNTAPVGSLRPNAFGAYDMHGNVWEMVADCYVPHYQQLPTDGSPDYSGDCTHRVKRGASWYNSLQPLRPPDRNKRHPAARDQFHGFRVVRELN